MRIEDINDRHISSIDKWYRMCAGAGSEITAFENGTIRGNPKSGERPVPDDLAGGELLGLITAEGMKPCAWTQQFHEAEQYIHTPPSLLSSGGKTGFTAEFPWHDFSSLCGFKGDELHPRYGHGLFLRQSFAVRVDSELDGIKLGLELNAQELDEKPAGYGFGSYCYNVGCLHFVGFFPNFVSKAADLKNLYYSAVSRAHAMSTRFAGDDWSEQFSPDRQPKAKSATQLSAEAYSMRTKRNRTS